VSNSAPNSIEGLVAISNTGSVASGAFIVHSCIDNLCENSNISAGLAPGQNLPLTPFETLPSLDPGSQHTLTASIDSNNQVTESNEGNNTSSKSMTVPAAAGQPDLIVEITGTDYDNGEEIVSYKVSNIGSGLAANGQGRVGLWMIVAPD